MSIESYRKWIALGLLGAIAPVAGALAQATPEAAPPIAAPPNAVPLTVRFRAPDQRDGEVLALVADGEQTAVQETPTSEYYIGIALGELPAVARQQLRLEHGLVVDDVIADSPAAKAEFKPQDILIRVGETALDEPADILKAVDEAKDKEMRIIILRDGKEMTLKVTPAKRPKPEPAQEEAVETRLPQSAIQRIEEAHLELKGQDGAGRAVELYFPRPAVVAQQRVAVRVEMPKDLKISITHEGDAPAKIHIEREGKIWDTTSDKVNDLPEDVRGQVEQLLSRVVHPMLSARARALVVPRGANVNPPMLAPRTVAPAASGASTSPVRPGAVPAPPTYSRQNIRSYRVAEGEGGSLEAKLDQILKKLGADDDQQALDKLREELERLRKEVDSLKNK